MRKQSTSIEKKSVVPKYPTDPTGVFKRLSEPCDSILENPKSINLAVPSRPGLSNTIFSG